MFVSTRGGERTPPVDSLPNQHRYVTRRLLRLRLRESVKSVKSEPTASASEDCDGAAWLENNTSDTSRRRVQSDDAPPSHRGRV